MSNPLPAREPLKVVLLENVHQSAVEIFHAEGFEVEQVRGALVGEELRARIAGAHVVGIRSKTQMRGADLASAKKLLTLGCFCIGTNQVDLEAANHLGIPVFNA